MAWLNLSCLEAITFWEKRHGSFSKNITTSSTRCFTSLSHGALKDAKVQENMIALQNLCQNNNPNPNYGWEQYQEPMK